MMTALLKYFLIEPLHFFIHNYTDDPDPIIAITVNEFANLPQPLVDDPGKISLTPRAVMIKNQY